MTLAVTVNLRAKAFRTNQFVEHVKRMHEEKNKGFEEEFKVAEAQHECICNYRFSSFIYILSISLHAEACTLQVSRIT